MQHARADFYAKLIFRAKNLRSVTPLGRNTVNGDEFFPPSQVVKSCFLHKEGAPASGHTLHQNLMNVYFEFSRICDDFRSKNWLQNYIKYMVYASFWSQKM